MGTLNQHLGRFTLSAADLGGIIKLVDTIQSLLKITSTEGENMYTMLFDTARLTHEWNN